MGQDDFDTTTVLLYMSLGTVALSIFSGVLTWNIIEPECIFEIIGFLILWAIFSKIGHFFVFGIIYLLSNKNK